MLFRSSGTPYYVRAYATTSAGTAYGNQVSFTTAVNLTIGQSYAGGIIFYIDGTGQHGLVAASGDQSTGIKWWNGSYVTTGASGTTIGTGQSNTTTIVSVQGAGSYAAKLCNDLVLNSYDDWFMPSKNELALMYTNLKLAGLGSFSAQNYWSSSEIDDVLVWSQHFDNGNQDTYDKMYATNNCVRAVRAF